MVIKICVVGGGIIGVSTAVLAAEKMLDVEVTLISEKFTPYTTGDGSAGFIKPYLLGNVSEDRLKFWFEKTLEYFQEISQYPNAIDYGVGLLSCYDLFTKLSSVPVFSDSFLHFRALTSKELAQFPSRYKSGFFFTTFYVECTKLLPILLKKIVSLGGKIIKEKVESFEQLEGKYDVVINCSGLGARNLASDSAVIPIRGQVMRVAAPWIKHAVMDDECYILPNSEEVICGGTHQEGDWNLEVDPADRQRIWNGCTELVPSLKNARILREWVGLRPGRDEPRLERETVKTAKGDLQVIHNYGHGGSGVTICWGCAHEVMAILEDVINEKNLEKLTSNL